MDQVEQLMAITPIDGRYANRVSELAPIVSEFGLIKYRVAVEAGWLSTLGSGILPDVERMPDSALSIVEAIPDGFTVDDAARIKEIEGRTNHDVKAVEYWLRERLAGTDWEDHLELVHFGCTSEDINNLAYAMMLSDARSKVLQPGITSIVDDLDEKAIEYAELPLLARTHGQPATPTTVGKEFAIFSKRLHRASEALGAVTIMGKFNGASGNYNATTFAYPEVDWHGVSRQFVEKLGFTFNPLTAQIEPHDWTAQYLTALNGANGVMIDLSQDMWQYIRGEIFKLKVIKDEVGSSAMPHKVNPIDFENAEGNLKIARWFASGLAQELVVSRMQRDLSDSTMQRSLGTLIAQCVVAHKSLLKGLGKIEPNEPFIRQELDNNWGVLAEAVQTVMRRYNVQDAYEILKEATRGVGLTRESYAELIEGIDVPEEAKERLRELTPSSYIGLAPGLTTFC